MRDMERLRFLQNRRELEVAEDRLLLEVRDVARILRMTPRWVREQIKAGRFIHSFLLAPGERRFRLCDVENYVAKRLAEADPEESPAVEEAATQEKS